MGEAFDLNIEKIGDYIISLEKLCDPYELRIEGPIDTGAKISTMEGLRDLRIYLESKDQMSKLLLMSGVIH